MFEKVTGISAEQFDAEHRGRAHYFGRSKQAWADGLLGWPELNELLANSSCFCDRISVVKEDKRLDRRLFTAPRKSGDAIRPGAIRKALHDGHSLLLDQVQQYHPPARRLTEYFSSVLGEVTGINVYVSWKSDKCFDTHWDDHDVFILQTEGEKQWSVFRPKRPHPLRFDLEEDRDKADVELVWEGALNPGDCLYIPRGWWHHAVSTGRGSIHMTLGFTSRNYVDLFEFLAVQAARDPHFRADVARLGSANFAEANAAFVDRFKEFIADQSSDLITRFWRHHYSMLAAPAASNLPLAIEFDDFAGSDLTLEIASIAPLISLERHDDDFSIALDGRTIALHNDAYELVRAFAKGGRLRSQWVVDQAFGGLSPNDARALLFELVNEGVLTVAA